jgi:hypothetical protein
MTSTVETHGFPVLRWRDRSLMAQAQGKEHEHNPPRGLRVSSPYHSRRRTWAPLHADGRSRNVATGVNRQCPFISLDPYHFGEEYYPALNTLTTSLKTDPHVKAQFTPSFVCNSAAETRVLCRTLARLQNADGLISVSLAVG